MPTVFRRLGALIVALLLGGGVAIAAAPAAQAEDFPLVTFKIHDWDGFCGEIVAGSLTQQPCATLDLRQQFTYNPLTHQLIAYDLRCGTATGLNSAMTFQTCDTNNADQRWERVHFDEGYFLITPYNDSSRFLVAENNEGGVYLLRNGSKPVGSLFTFTLI